MFVQVMNDAVLHKTYVDIAHFSRIQASWSMIISYEKAPKGNKQCVQCAHNKVAILGIESRRRYQNLHKKCVSRMVECSFT